MYPWRLVGCEEWVDERGDECVRLYCERELILEPGHNGTGTETHAFYYKKKYVKYEPILKQLIVVVQDGRNYVQQVIVVGQI